MKLRPFLLVTGTVSVEGGDHSERAKSSSVEGNEQRLVIERTLTEDRREANTIATTAMRDLRRLRVLKTPFGTLVPIERAEELADLLDGISREVARFNAGAKTAQLVNAMISEPLKGPRREAVEGWIARKIRTGDADVKEARRELEA